MLCLKCLGRRSRANSAGRHTTKAVPESFHDMVSSVLGSSTIAYVFVRNGGVPAAGDAIGQAGGPGARRSACRGEGRMREESNCFHGNEDASRNVDLGMGLGWTLVREASSGF